MRNLRCNIGSLSLMAALLVVGGCAKGPPPIVPAEGTVTLDGAPVPRAKVLFYPQFDAAQEYIAQGLTDEKGHFALTCHGQSGACAVENIVIVIDEDAPTELLVESKRAELATYKKGLKNRPIPQKYRTMSESKIKILVSAEKKDYNVELTR